jgi:shikimate dehydrogenase
MNSDTVMTGVFGFPVRHSKSPVMHNAAFDSLQLNYRYGAFEINPGQLKDAVSGIRALGFRGVNVTIPHKVEVMNYLDEIDPDAELIGAVNTIVNDSGHLKGYNTDGIGYVRSLKEELQADLTAERVLLIGAGGAAKGVAVALAREGISQLWIANRTIKKAEQLASQIRSVSSTDSSGIGLERIGEIKEKITLLVNTTSVGMHPNTGEIPVDPAFLHDRMKVSDLIYNPFRTRLLQEAKQCGARIHGGLGMFIYQGAYAFEYWTGQQAPVRVMRTAVERSMGQC